MARSTSVLAAALAFGALGLPACNRDLVCTSEVTQGGGIFRGTVKGSGSEADLRRRSVRVACGQLCAGGNPARDEGCVGRCAVDAEAGKIGVRTTCGKEGSSK